MENVPLHPALEHLLIKVASDLGDIAMLCSDASDHLEDGKLLSALGAISSCGERLRNATVAIRAVHEWQEKLNQPPLIPPAEKGEH